MQYEILAENAAGGEFPRAYAERFYGAEEIAIDLAHELAEDGRTGRTVVRNGYDEAVINVRVRGPLTLVYEHRSGDLPVAYWNGTEFDYFEAHARHYGGRSCNRQFLTFKPVGAGSMAGGTFLPA